MQTARKAHSIDRPPAWEEALSSRLFRLLAPTFDAVGERIPPPRLDPWHLVDIPRPGGARPLAATWFPTSRPPRGAVLLVPPWKRWGRAYFHRRGRLEALRTAGYHSLTVDLPNIDTDSKASGFYDRDIAVAASYLAKSNPGLPLYLWGVSSGGYWAHAVLASRRGFSGAMFEDVSPHLLEWAWREAPWGRPFYLFFRAAFRRSYAFLDARRHASRLLVNKASYVIGGRDAGIPLAVGRDLVGSANHRLLVIPEAGHLEAIKRAPQEVLDLALATFA